MPKASVPPPPKPKKFESIAEIDRALKLMERRLGELDALDPSRHRHDGPEVESVESGIRSAITTIYGTESPEYREHHDFVIDDSIVATSRTDWQARFAEKLPKARGKVTTLIKLLKETRDDFEPAGSPANRRTSMAASRIFIGHGRSREWYALREFIQTKLGHECVEFNSVPTAGMATKERLEQMLDQCGFAFLVMTGEDERDGELHARENVVHEVGLFQGRLGWRKAIVMLEDGCAPFSNIVGVTWLPFPKGRIESAFEDVRATLEREAFPARTRP